MTHSLSIVDRAGKTAIAKQIRALGFPLSQNTHFSAQIADNENIQALLKEGALTDTCAAHRLPKKVRGEKRPLPSITKRHLHEYRAAIIERVRTLTRSLYRCSQSSWAGGDTFVVVDYSNTPSASGTSVREHSPNGKWTGNDARLSVAIQPKWDKEIEAVPGLKDAAGMLTTHAKQVNFDLWEASWIRQGRGFNLVSESGVILRVGAEWVHAKTEKAARTVLARRRATEEHATRTTTRAAYVRSLSPADIVALYPTVEVCLKDSLASGNCEAGTLSWRETHGFGDKTCTTVAEILATNDQSTYVMRAVRTALIRAKVAPQLQAA